jgi:hypothetical protein
MSDYINIAPSVEIHIKALIRATCTHFMIDPESWAALDRKTRDDALSKKAQLLRDDLQSMSLI